MTPEETISVLDHKHLTFEQMKELQQMQLQHDWEALRNQAAIAAMQGLIVADSNFNLGTPELAVMAIQHANELIKQLKGKEL